MADHHLQDWAKYDPRTCLGCGQKENESYQVGVGSFYNFLIKHHLTPKSKGGKSKGNLAVLCVNCHRKVHSPKGKLHWGKTNKRFTSLLQSRL